MDCFMVILVGSFSLKSAPESGAASPNALTETADTHKKTLCKWSASLRGFVDTRALSD